MLQRRRREMVAAAVAMLHEGVARGEFPSWIEIGPLANGFAALLDGIGLLAMEEGAGYRRAEAERRALAMIDLLFASRDAASPAPLEPARPRPYASLRLG
jgi:hypothetical protein